jgi:prepilin-type processing-associated H-X9-DG protein
MRTSVARETRDGYTWLEVTVCLVAILFLMGLAVMFVAPPSSRGGSHKTDCINNQRNIALALFRFEGENNRLPGWLNSQNPDADGLGGRETGWVFPLLPYLDRTDLYDTYRASGEVPQEHLKILVCHEDRGAISNGAHMSYAVNAGFLGGGPSSPDEPAAGVFTRQYRQSKDEAIHLVNLSQITDGLATTILFSENIDAGQWTSPNEGCTSITWERTEPPRGKGFYLNELTGSGECKYPRPSSFHEGGAVVTFCDGHSQFVHEGIEYSVYQQLMTPNGRTFDQRPLNESSY